MSAVVVDSARAGRGGRGRATLGVGGFAALAALVGVGLWLVDPFGWSGDRALQDALVQRGRVVVHGGGKTLAALTAEGAKLVPVASVPVIAAALAGDEPEALSRAMREGGVDALLIDARAPAPAATLAGRLGRHASVPGLRALHLAPEAALYALDPTAELSDAHRAAMAKVARGLLGGVRPPRVTSFPEPLRRLRSVEVMVLIRQGPRPRLWRSARGNSIARALITAAVVARKRWFEREQAMGGPIDTLLPHMSVEVALLADDGTIGSREPAFIDRVFTPDHGVAYERKGSWRYLLPGATRDKGRGRASVAYRELLSDDGLPPERFGSPDLRLYRLLVDTLVTSEATPPVRDALSPLQDPDELFGGDAGVAGGEKGVLGTAPRRKHPEPDDGLGEVGSPDEVLAP